MHVSILIYITRRFVDIIRLRVCSSLSPRVDQLENTRPTAQRYKGRRLTLIRHMPAARCGAPLPSAPLDYGPGVTRVSRVNSSVANGECGFWFCHSFASLAALLFETTGEPPNQETKSGRYHETDRPPDW